MHTTTPPARRPAQPTTMVALEAMLLWPRGIGGPAATIETSLWPVFAIVLGDREEPIEPDIRPLFDLLHRPEHTSEITVVEGRCDWTVLDHRRALLKLTVHTRRPVHFDAAIILPAKPVIGILDVLARGATIAITTQRHAARLVDRVDIRDALDGLVLYCCRQSTQLAELAQALHRVQDGEQAVT